MVLVYFNKKRPFYINLDLLGLGIGAAIYHIYKDIILDKDQ